MSDSTPTRRLFVVVPCHNEARCIESMLDSLRAQTDRMFELVIVDNASSDDTRHVMDAYRGAHPDFAVRCIDEPEKGTGSAADTGFRFAIAAGATHLARTDADCLARHDWVENIKRAFDEGSDFVAGHIGFRTDDTHIGVFELAGLSLVTMVMRLVAPLLRHNRGSAFKSRYVMAGGGNLAVTASLYLASGGFPRIRIEDDNDDRVLTNRVRKLTARVRRDRRVVVYQSARRVRHYGWRKTVLWYWNRKARPDVVDVR